MNDFGVRSSVAPLLRVAVRPPEASSDFAGAHWNEPVDRDLLLTQHAAFVKLLQELGCHVEILDPVADLPDSTFTYDPAFVIPTGTIQLRGAKSNRIAEPELLAGELEQLGIPTVARLSAPATGDGGDMFWLDEQTLAVGRTYRTNQHAVDQLRNILEPLDIKVQAFDLPHDLGPEYCLHLMSVISPIRSDLAVVYPKLAPVALLQALDQRGIEWVEVPDDEYQTLACNVLAIRPGVVVMTAGNDQTANALRAKGVDVHLYEASEINKGEGGPTCLTRPILRS